MPYGQPYLITGGGGTGFRRNNAPVALALLVFLLLLGAGSYLIWVRLVRVPPRALDAAPVAATTPAPGPAFDDVAVHVDNALSHLGQEMEAIRRAEQRMNLVMGALDRNYLGLEQRRLQSAEQLCEDGIWHAAAAFEELRAADQQLKQKGGH